MSDLPTPIDPGGVIFDAESSAREDRSANFRLQGELAEGHNEFGDVAARKEKKLPSADSHHPSHRHSSQHPLAEQLAILLNGTPPDQASIIDITDPVIREKLEHEYRLQNERKLAHLREHSPGTVPTPASG